MKLLFREGKTKVEIAQKNFGSLYHEIDGSNVGSWYYHEASIKTASSRLCAVSKNRGISSSISQTALTYFFQIRLYLQSVFQSPRFESLLARLHDVVTSVNMSSAYLSILLSCIRCSSLLCLVYVSSAVI